MKPKCSRRSLLKTTTAAVAGVASREWVFADPRSNDTLPFEEYFKFDAVGLADLVHRREVTPLEILNTAIQRLEQVNPILNAIVGDAKHLDQVYELARNAIQTGLPDGPLRGVPVAFKDLGFMVAGVESASGSRLFEGIVPATDSLTVARLRAAGLVFVARTATPELGLLTTTESKLNGITRNPWNLDRTVGGSSGGSAAAVSAGMVPVALGGDGGGSIRIPASCCGLFGLKPSRERTPIGNDLVVQHAITRTVRDSAALLDATKGPTPGKTTIPPGNGINFSQQPNFPVRKLQIASVSSLPLMRQPLHADCKRGLDKTRQLLSDLDHRVVDETAAYGKLLDWEELFKGLITYLLPGFRIMIEQRLSQLGRRLKDGDVENTTKSYYNQAKGVTGVEVIQARMALDGAAEKLAHFMSDKEYDMILTPTLAQPPIEHGIITLDAEDPKVYLDKYRDFSPFTFIANCTGQPAMSVPLHLSEEGLPIGMQFIGKYGDEATLFRLAGQLEETENWLRQRPPSVPWQ